VPSRPRTSLAKPRYRFEIISEEHLLDNFECEHTFLTIFLRTQALLETQQDLSRTYVLLDTGELPENSVVGYFTLRADSVAYTPRGGKFTSIPVIEITYLARHIRRKGRILWGIGPELLIEAMRHVELVSQHIGVRAIHLSYTDEGKSLYEDYGFVSHPYGDGWMLLPMTDVRILLTEEDALSLSATPDIPESAPETD